MIKNCFLKIIKNPILILFVISIPATYSLLSPGFYGASDDIHIAWLQQMDKTIKNGQIPPRYVPDLSFGFGYPLFNFVFPMPFYLGEIIHLIGLSFVDSIKMVFGLSIILSAISMYYLAKKLSNVFGGIVAATVYVYTPYRSNDIYNRGALGESIAFIFFPIIILSLIELSKSNKISKKWLFLGGLPISFLILSHNIAAYMFLPFAFLLAIYLKINFKSILTTFAIGLLISSYFWVPAILDSHLMQYSTVFNFLDHYPTLMQLFKPYWGYGASVPGPYDGMSFHLGSINIMLIIIAIFTKLFRKKTNIVINNKIINWLIFSTIFSIFMMNFRSSIFWKTIPLLPYFQFPWRFLMITTFTTPLLIISIFKNRFFNIISILFVFVAIISNYKIFQPHDFLDRKDEYYLNRYIPIPVASNEYKQLGEEYLRLPLVTQKRPDQNMPLLKLKSGNVTNLFQENPFKVTFNYSGPEQVVEFNRYLFPGWVVKINGKIVDLLPGDPWGQISFKIPEGTSQISVTFTETYLKLILDIISFTSFLITLNYIRKNEK